MAATITKGYTFGATELVTNTKLHTLVDSATITGITTTELASGFLSSLATVAGGINWYGIQNDLLTSLASSAGKLPQQNFWNFNSAVATDASVPDVGSYTGLKLYWSTYGSIASFANARTGQNFTLFAGQASMPALIDTGNLLLSGNWIPAKADDNLTLMWDGTNFIEIARISV